MFSPALPQSVLTALMPVLDWMVVQSGQDPTYLRSEAQLSQLVLGKYNEEAAPLLAKNQACLALFLQALKSPVQPYPDIPSIQVMALEQVCCFFHTLFSHHLNLSSIRKRALKGCLFYHWVELLSHLFSICTYTYDLTWLF